MKNNKWTLDSISEGNVTPQDDTLNNIGWEYKTVHLIREGILTGTIQCMNTGNWAKVEDFESISEFMINALNNYERLKADNEVLLNALKKIIDLFPENPKLPISYQVLGFANEALSKTNNLFRKEDIEAIKQAENK